MINFFKSLYRIQGREKALRKIMLRIIFAMIAMTVVVLGGHELVAKLFYPFPWPWWLKLINLMVWWLLGLISFLTILLGKKSLVGKKLNET